MPDKCEYTPLIPLQNMLSVTPVDAKKMADSVDVDDMEASLFGSFNRSQNQRRQIKRKNSASSASTVQEAATSGMIVSNEQRKNEITSQPQKQEPKATPTERPQAKKFGKLIMLLQLRVHCTCSCSLVPETWE